MKQKKTGILYTIRWDWIGIKYTVSDKEKQYSELFAAFFHTIAIKERENPTLQLNMLPLRYREYMTEFRQNVKTF